MAAGTFQKDSLGWQWQQWQLRLGEWWELQLKKFPFQWLESLDPGDLDLSALENVFLVIFTLVLIILLIWAVWRIGNRLQSYFFNLKTPINRRVSLTLARDLSPTEWLRHSQLLQQQGKYNQAFRCLYLGMLQQLHEKGIVSHQASRTDEEYRVLLLQLPQLDACENLLILHQQICFGRREVSPNLLVQCQRSYEQILREFGANS